MRNLSEEDAEVIVDIERACSALSLIGCVFVLATFAISDAFRQRAINRMVFYATFGNMLTNIGTLMTRSYTHDVDSFGCQFQAFLIQVFMQGDAYWALAMAINVYLTFYHKYDARMLRRMEIPYFICCYGIPFIPGFTFLFVSNDHGRPYGNAVLWCWLRPEWDIYRIAVFYAPVWVAIIVAMAIYIRAGREIYNKRRKMLNFSSTGTGTAVANETFSPLFSEFSPAFNFKTTEVVQTTEIIQPPPPTATGGGMLPASGPLKDPNVSYSVTISADAQAAANTNALATRTSADLETLDATTVTLHSVASDGSNPNPKRGQVLSSCTTTTQVSVAPTAAAANNSTTNDLRARRRNNYELHNAIWSYTKCAILFFSVLLITWIPSSGNRVYSLINGGDVSRPLFFASAFVLPLQGFWNAIIYIVTSWAACKGLWGSGGVVVGGLWSGWRRRESVVEIVRGDRGRRHSEQHHGGRGRQGGGGGGVGGMWGHSRKGEESTSMEDLTGEGRVERVSPV